MICLKVAMQTQIVEPDCLFTYCTLVLFDIVQSYAVLTLIDTKLHIMDLSHMTVEVSYMTRSIADGTF